jgi:hypothetical protein
VLIKPHIRIISLFWTKGKRTMLDGICGKIGAQCHVSHEKAKRDFVPYVKFMMQTPGKKASALIAWFEFTPEEVDFLLNMNRF